MFKENRMLWFDVGIKRYTTPARGTLKFFLLWFDVGIKRYTTLRARQGRQRGCGLM